MTYSLRKHTTGRQGYPRACRGVLASALLLAGFHAGFAWLTLRALGAPQVATTAVGCALAACLPLVPPWAAVLPAAAALAGQGLRFRAAALLAAHVAAAAYADDVILRGVPGSHPYLTGLGVVGAPVPLHVQHQALPPRQSCSHVDSCHGRGA